MFFRKPATNSTHVWIIQQSCRLARCSSDSTEFLLTQADYPDKHDGFFARYWNHGYLVGCHIGGGPRKCIREYNKALVRDDGIALSKALHYLSDLACPFHTIPTSLETHVSYERYVKSNLEEICALVEEVEPVHGIIG